MFSKLNIWVCFKVQPDFDHVLEADWESFGPGSDIRYAKQTFNCFDESSLEIALRLKDALHKDGHEIRLGAITLADSLQASVQRSLFAAGYDEILRIAARIEFSPAETGKRLAAHLAARTPDLVLLGKQAGYADTGMVPHYVARGLGYPLLADAENILWDGQRLSVETPAAVVIGNSPVAALRMSTLSQQLAAKTKQAQVIQDESPVLDPPVLVRNRPRRSVKMLEADALPDIISELLARQATAREQATGMSADGKYIIRKCCGSHLEWHIPIGDERAAWPMPPPAQILRLLLVGGRGMGGKAGIQKLQRLASLLGGQVGFTRTAAQNGWGWGAMDAIIGQSGIIVQPELCIAFGASGASAFMAGVEKARILIAVNTDPDAPIFNYADYGVIADAGTTAGALLEAFA